MKKAVLLLLALSVSITAQSVPDINYDANADILSLPSYGEVAGVATNSKGHVFVYARTGHAVATLGDERTFYHNGSRLFQFDQNGKFVKEIGQGVYAVNFAQQVRVDPQDNVWVVDEGTNMLIKFNPQGRVAMVLGRRPEAVAGATQTNAPPVLDKKYQFGRPTDVAWDAQGNIFVADGYVNSRVVKYDKNGRFVKAIGQRGSAPGDFNTPHTIAADAKGNIYVADRNNRRIQVFDGDGNFQREIKIDVPFDENARPAIGNKPDLTNYRQTGGTFAPGAPWALCITPGPNQVLYASDAYPGRVYKLSLDGKVLGVLGESGKQPKQFGWIHEMACPSENVLFVAEILNWRVQKLILHPEKMKAVSRQ